MKLFSIFLLFIIFLTQLPASYGQIDLQSVSAIAICGTDETNYNLEELSSCEGISVAGQSLEVVSFLLSLRTDYEVTEMKIKGKKFSNEAIDLMKKFKDGDMLYVEHVVLEDGEEANGFRKFRIIQEN